MIQKTLKPCDKYRDEFIVEHIYDDGTVDMVRFSGPNAKEKAELYWFQTWS